MKLELSSALRNLNTKPDSPYRGVLLDARQRVAVACDGVAIAIVPLPANFPLNGDRQIDGNLSAIDAASVDKSPAPSEDWGWEAILENQTEPVYRVALNAATLHRLAGALGDAENIILEFGARVDSPIRVMPFGKSGQGEPCGYIMAGSSGQPDGLLVSEIQTHSDTPPATVKIQFNAERKSIELIFPGKPKEAIREELKDHGFRWFAKGKLWYAKDTEARRKWTESFVSTLAKAA